MKLREPFLQALLREIEIKQDFFPAGTGIDTIYFGGGTPSILTVKEIGAVCERLRASFDLEDTAEITLEANPDDLDKVYLRDIKESGISRLSIGIQSFDDNLLQYMNRAHDRHQAVRSLEYAASLGFNEINIDLIYGIPGLTNEAWEQELSFAVQFKIEHLSAYALTVEPKTALDHFIHKKNWPAPDDTAAAQQFLIASDYLQAHGFTHYEISNFAKENLYSRHNTAYWKSRPYLGLGPSAHSYRKGERSWNVAHNAKYIRALSNGETPAVAEVLSETDRFNEYLMTGLRTQWGIDLERIGTEFGESARDHIKRMLTDVDPDHYTINGNTITLTRQGWLWSDSVIASLFLG